MDDKKPKVKVTMGVERQDLKVKFWQSGQRDGEGRGHIKGFKETEGKIQTSKMWKEKKMHEKRMGLEKPH